MLRISTHIIFIIFVVFITSTAYAAPIQPYYKLGSLAGDINSASATVKESLAAAGFDVVGEYSPMEDPAFRAIVYTRDDIVSALGNLDPTRMFAAALKVGLQAKGGKVAVTMTNPEYIFRAYTQKEFDKAKAPLLKISRDAVAAFSSDNGFGKATPMGGGGLDSEKLYKYHYMFGMEYFDEPVRLNSKKADFATLTARIEKRIADGVSDSALVYTIKPAGKKIAVYGIALKNKEDGEKFFLPIIGVDHIAAMPFEIIVINDRAYSLHGRYRIALHWPALTMGTFTNIISTPGEVADQFKALAK